jgi:hypothetical protein
MAGLSTVQGGVQHVAVRSPLTGAEKAAVQAALTKLSGSGASGALATHVSATGGTLPYASLKTITKGVLTGLGQDTFAGGISGGRVALTRFPSDSVVGGSAAKAPVLGSGVRLSAESIGLKGVTAAGVKAIDPNVGLALTHTVTLTDKTTLTITGVHGHVIKPSSH